MKNDPYLAFEISYYLKDKKGNVSVYSNCYVRTIYSRTEEGAIKKFKNEVKNASIDNVEIKMELTYQDMFEILSKMTVKQRKQPVMLYNETMQEEVYMFNPFFAENENKIAFEVTYIEQSY